MPAKPKNYLSQSGTKAFLDDTSRWYAARNNDLLLNVDKALSEYIAHQNDPPVIKATYIEKVLVASQKWIESKQDKVGSQQHSFRLPVVVALKDQAESEKRVIMLQCLKNASLERERNEYVQRVQAQQAQQRSAEVKAHFVHAGQAVGKLAKGTHVADRGLKVNMLSTTDQGRDNYWLEAADPKHRIGQNFTKLGPGFQLSDSKNIFDHADKMMNAGMKELEKNQVVYMEDLVVRTLFEVDFEGGKLTSKMSPDLQQKVVTNYQSEPDKKKMARKDLFNAAGDRKPLDTQGWKSKGWSQYGDGWACFVMSAYGTVYIGEHQGGTFHHSSFLCGAPVLAAGMIKVVDGKVVAISEKNGHYKCDAENMKQFVRFLQNRLPGEMNPADVDYYTHSGTYMSLKTMLDSNSDDLDPDSVANAIKGNGKVRSLAPDAPPPPPVAGRPQAGGAKGSLQSQLQNQIKSRFPNLSAARELAAQPTTTAAASAGTSGKEDYNT